MEITDPSPFSHNGSNGAGSGASSGTNSEFAAPNPTSAPSSRSQSAENEEEQEQEEDDIAFAAEAAANAVEEADAEQQRLDQALLRCRVCGQGVTEGRPLLRFLPMDQALASLTIQALPQNTPLVATFAEDICLHVFCGKTASILPTVNQPDLEILTKAGLKNKHGIGAEVNAALARTRCATLVTLQDSEETTSSAASQTAQSTRSNRSTKQEKQYYLVREFEAHLAAVRFTHNATFSDETSAPAVHAMPPSSSSPNNAVPKSTTSGMVAHKQQTISQRNTPASIPSAYPTSADAPVNTGPGPASSMLSLHTTANGPLPQPLTSQLQTNDALSQSQRDRLNPDSSNPGFAMPTTGMFIGAPQLLGIANAAYPNTNTNTNTNNIPYVHMMPQQNLLLQYPAAAMFASANSNLSATGNNVTGHLWQAPTPPPIGAIPLPPQLPRGQQHSLPGMMPFNGGVSGPRAKTLLQNNTGTDIISGLGGGSSGVSENNSWNKGSPPKRAAAGKTGSKPPKSNEKQGAFLVTPLTNPGNGASDGKIKCGCGGAYLNANASSWRNHVITKRHQRWMESQVLSGQYGNDME